MAMSQAHADEYQLIHEYRFSFLEQQILQLHLPTGATALDVGCYPPAIFNFLKAQGFHTSGIASHHEKLMDKTVKVLNIETDPFPWKDNTFELVVLTEVIEHLPHNPLVPLQEIMRVLAPGGFVLITTPNAAKLHHRLKLLAGKSTSFPVEQLLTVQAGTGSLYHLHHREYTLAELYELVALSGLQVVRAAQVCLYPPTRRKVRQERLPTQAVKWMGYLAQQLRASFKDSLFILAQKPLT